MTYQKRDHFHRKAKQQGFKARSVFKLEELDKRFKLFRSGQLILDLGCSPGSWSQYVVNRIQPHGQCWGLDIEPCEWKHPQFHFVLANFLEPEGQMAPVLELTFQGVLSDMAPKTSGIHDVDHARSLELCREALSVARQVLETGGFFLCKVFDGGDTGTFETELKSEFGQLTRLRPEAVRKASREFYFLAQQFKGK